MQGESIAQYGTDMLHSFGVAVTSQPRNSSHHPSLNEIASPIV